MHIDGEIAAAARDIAPLPRKLGMTIKALRAILTRHPDNVHQALRNG
jgi:hypothetical protein